MESKFRKFYVDWWNIKKSTVYGIIAGVVFLCFAIGGGWWLWRSNAILATPENADIPKDAARIVSYEGDVRVIRASTRETILVTKETYVAAGDTVQTQADGRAQIQMIDGSLLSVRPNSTIVIRDSASIFGGTNVRVTLDEGQMNVKTQDQTENTENVVEVKESENRLFPQTDASFKINEQTNGGEIRVSRGGVESNTGIDKTVVKENEFASIDNGKISQKERLLDAPKPVAPQNAEQVLNSSDVTFRWQKPDSTSPLNFHLQVSASPFFVADSMLIERENITNQIFTVANLTPGVYYWRLKATSASRQGSDWGEPWKFAIIKQSRSETLEANEWQVEKVGGSIYIISGRTKPGTTVRSSGREVFASGDGSFKLQVSSSSGASTVEISDEKGNRTRYNLSLNNSRATRLN